MAIEFDFFDIQMDHPHWEENYHNITSVNHRRDLMLYVERISNELAPTCTEGLGKECVDMIYNEDMDPAVVVNKIRDIMWNYSEEMVVDGLTDAAEDHYASMRHDHYEGM